MSTPVVPVSTIPAAVAYLIPAVQTQLAEDPNVDSILVALADPGDGPDVPDEIVFFGEVRSTVDPATFVGDGGQFWLEEHYEIECVASVFTGSLDNDGAYTIQLGQLQRAYQVAAYIETAVRLDPSLGELVQRAYPLGRTQPRIERTESPVGLLVEVTVLIRVDVLN